MLERDTYTSMKIQNDKTMQAGMIPEVYTESKHF